ncbi:VRR-NUC domain-containing protein [Apibacter mensalis]|uniref:VRR-NUC domain-containing protein n=1 Tax=Apibacter mensalis TaxID=1586267 RepID=UPI0026F33BED|nr:VRR-NUC domain-containing protein [Apibacter mensalis]
MENKEEIKIRKKRENPESRLQRACIKWFKLQYPKETIFAIPNGGKRGKIEAAIMKGEGVMAGVSDLFLMRGKERYHGLFIEMKAKNGKLRENQRVFIEDAERKDYKVEVCYSLEEFIEKVNNYLNKK